MRANTTRGAICGAGRLAGAAALAALACVGSLPPAAVPTAADRSELIVPFRVNDEMRLWAQRRVGDARDDLERMERLLYALQEDVDGLRLTYREGYTATAEEAFTTGEVNCLSFSHLLVGLAREVGVPAYYLDVDRREQYARQEQLIVISGHVTVGFDYGIERQVVEFHIAPEVDFRRSRPMSDRRAQAHHYTNRGAEELQAGRLTEALELLEIAVSLEPDLTEAWLDLGVARRRSGDLDGAERAYRRAIDADSNYQPAYLNLSVLARHRGDSDAARMLLRLLDRKDNRNPFILLSLGDLSLDEGELDAARRFYRRARRLDPSHPEPTAALGLWARAAGDVQEARSWLAKARALDPHNPRVRRLAAALGEGSGEPGPGPA